MSPRPEDDPSSPDSSRPGGLATVFRSLTNPKSVKPPPPLLTPPTALPRAELINAIPSSSRELSTNHMDAFELLKNGNSSERISAANTLKYAITEYPLNPILDIWYAGKDLIHASNPSPMRVAGWELLTECAKHSSSTDLERKEYFQTLSATANSEDFHLQLAALVDLTNHGRILAGFDYDLLPLLTAWLQEAFNATRLARRNSHPGRNAGGTSRGKTAASGEDENFVQLFLFLLDVIKFSFNTADEPAVTDLIDTVLTICMNTNQEDDLRSCIKVLDSIVTFGFIPQSKLKDCVQVLSSIYCLVPNLEKNSWHTIADLCKSHNGQATVRIMLDILRNLQPGVNEKDSSREIRGSLAVLQKLLSKTAEKGYPAVPYALLVDGLSNTLRATKSARVYVSILQLINSLFDDGEGRIHRLIVDEDWSTALDVAAGCYRRTNDGVGKQPSSVGESLTPNVDRELLRLIRRLDVIIKEKSGDFIPRQTIIQFFTDVHALLPDESARTVLDYFQEFRCCSPSDLRWEENLNLVLYAFFGNRSRSSDTRLRALQTTMDAYEIVDLVGDGAEQNFIPRLAKSVLQNIAEEDDVLVLDAIMTLMVSVVVSSDMELFQFIVEALRLNVVSDRLKSPISPAMSATISPTSVDAPSPSPVQPQSPSNVVTTGYVRMFLRTMNTHSEKSARLYDVLVGITRTNHCEVDARLTAMKLLFRLRADWANRIFVTDDLDNTSLATAMCRTDASYAKKQADEAAQSLRLSRADHANHSRTSRGVSLSQTQIHERGVPVRTPSGGKSLLARYHQLWRCPDPKALPDAIPSLISPVLLSHNPTPEPMEDGDIGATEKPRKSHILSMSSWLDAVLDILQGSEWEIYSFVLVHLPSQLSNHAIFIDAMPQIQELRRIICDHIRTSGFQEPPFVSGLRRADVAICLFHSLTMILSYHEHFGKGDEDEIVKTFILGIGTWERTAKYCIHALSICCHELPLSTSKSLVQMLNQMAASITQPHVSVHILEFLACLSRLHNVYVNFREDEYRIVFGICFRYLEYARDKRQSNRSSHNSEPSTPGTPGAGMTDATHVVAPSEELPQYVHALAYHVILFWFLALKLPDRATHVGWVAKKLFADSDNIGQTADEQALTSIDFMQRVTYADVDESAEDSYFTEDRFGQIVKKQWLIGNSIVTVKQATTSGWAQIIKRQPSGTSAYAIRETYTPPPPHQIENHVDVSREGQASTNAILPSHVLLQLMSPVPQSFESARPIPLPDDEAVDRAIRVFDRSSSVDSHKVGVVYIGEEQSDEAEILANVCGSSDYTEFLNNLGTLTKLKGATFNTQGLDREYDSDGQYTFCWRDRVTEIVFHVTTQMPTNLEQDPQCTSKKRHIGNDFVNIIFNDSGKPFRFDTFPSQFNYVNIIITPASRASFIATRTTTNASGLRGQPFYRVQVLSKPGFPEISPASETKMVSLTALPGFIRLLALNASVFCYVWNAREGGEHISSWSGRLREIKRLRERYGPKATTSVVPSPPPTASSQTHQSETSRPSSSVRDSFSSLRRTSVATFFTSTTEQTSHRSSMLSTSAPTNETEVGFTNGVSPLIESVDFSKWA
ncbi:Tuberous sclerosis 2-like protein [Conoideocrella luteorostrata]|uniref:Tuberous sclerosis 2-like protein n=1 Tax=Conoideocrella luteorostrata TaxID=1105319 RepID=A0AAJ0FMT6_9HYPO|nr:Tuberous sclerosis 2-like protein [Conoideocrella luteorostrata]